MALREFSLGEATSRTVVVTGVSGAIGSHLLTLLLDHGYTVRVLTRDTEALSARLPKNVICGDYAQMEEILKGADTVLHLAARNNDQAGERKDFLRDNVDLTLQIAEEARRQGVRLFIFATSTKALSS